MMLIQQRDVAEGRARQKILRKLQTAHKNHQAAELKLQNLKKQSENDLANCKSVIEALNVQISKKDAIIQHQKTEIERQQDKIKAQNAEIEIWKFRALLAESQANSMAMHEETNHLEQRQMCSDMLFWKQRAENAESILAKKEVVFSMEVQKYQAALKTQNEKYVTLQAEYKREVEGLNREVKDYATREYRRQKGDALANRKRKVEEEEELLKKPFGNGHYYFDGQVDYYSVASLVMEQYNIVGDWSNIYQVLCGKGPSNIMEALHCFDVQWGRVKRRKLAKPITYNEF